jgi:hypothetical protein
MQNIIRQAAVIILLLTSRLSAGTGVAFAQAYSSYISGTQIHSAANHLQGKDIAHLALIGLCPQVTVGRNLHKFGGDSDAVANPQDHTKKLRRRRMEIPRYSAKESTGGGGRTRTYDLRIMSHPTAIESKQLQPDSSANSGKVQQNPQPPRNKKGQQ